MPTIRNGGFGHDFTRDPTTIWALGERLPELGVTSFVPTLVMSPSDVTDLPPGTRADFCLLDADLQIVRTVVAGETFFGE